MTKTQQMVRNTLLIKELTELYVGLKRSLKVFDGRQRELAKWFRIELSTAKQTGRLLFSCEPTKRLRDLLATTEALCVYEDAGGAFAHDKSPNAKLRGRRPAPAGLRSLSNAGLELERQRIPGRETEAQGKAG